jgi:uncharacterized peroxidase-related enzyme
MSEETTDTAFSYYPVPALADLPADIRERIEGIAERSGFIPNVFMTLAHRPDEFRAFMAYHDALMDKESGLTKAEREMIVVVTSAANDCLYCVISHGAILRIRSKRPQLADQVTINWRSADLSDRERAICDAAMTLAMEPGKFGEPQREALRAVGLNEEDIWDLGAITAFFALSNRMAHVTDMKPNAEFYTMGR